MFEVKKHLIKVQGNRLYLPVAARLVWFRQEHPDWGIETRPVVIDMEKQYAIFEAKVYNAEGKLMAQGTKMENARGFPDFIEKAETGSIGRALAVCGFGTQFAPDLDEVPSGRVVDAPQPDRSSLSAERSAATGTPREHPAANGYARHGNGDERGADGAARANGSQNGHGRPHPSAEGAHRETAPEEEKPRSVELECSLCKRALTKGQELLSVRKFGVALCPECQKERRAVEAAA